VLLAISADRRWELLRRSNASVEVCGVTGAEDIVRRARQRIGDAEYGHWAQIDEKRIAQQIGWGESGIWRIWDWTTGEHLGRIDHPGARRVIALDAGGRKALVADDGDSLHVIDIRDGSSISLAGAQTNMVCAALSPCGAKVAVGMSDGTIWLGDSGAGYLRRAQIAGSGPATALAFSPRGNELLSAHGRLVRLWVLERSLCERELHLPDGEGNPVNAIYSPDGQRQVLWSSETIWICDAQLGLQLASIPLRHTLGHDTLEQRPLTVPFVFTEEGRQLCVADGESIVVLDLRTGQAHDGKPPSPILLLHNDNDSNTLVLKSGTAKPLAALPKFSRSGVVMPDGRTIVLEHAGWGRLEILKVEGMQG